MVVEAYGSASTLEETLRSAPEAVNPETLHILAGRDEAELVYITRSV